MFHLKENKTSVFKEFIAGLTTFMAMSYAILVIPAILSQTGMDYNAVYCGTVLASVFGTLFIGLIANVPYAQSTGIGLASLFTYTLCSSLGYSYKEALSLVLICGVINTVITLTEVRKNLVKAIPAFFQDAITVGIGLFISYIGLINSGIIVFKADGIQNGFALNVTPELGNLSLNMLLAIIGIFVLIFLSMKKVKGTYLITIILTTIIGLFMGITKLPNFREFSFAPKIAFAQFDFKGLFTADKGLLVLFMTILTLCISDLFDTIGVFIGTGKKSGIFKIDENGQIPKNMERAMIADSCGTIIASFFGTSNVTTYLESTAGIESGGRTGLTSVFVAIFFFLTLFLSPIISVIPMEAVSPVLIFIGISMISNVLKIDFNNIKEAIPSFFIIIMMPFAYSISIGIEWGFITYALVNIFAKKGEKDNISPIIYIFVILFIVKYIYQFLG